MPTDIKLAWTAAGALMALLLGTLVTVGMKAATQEDMLRTNEEQWKYIAQLEGRVREMELWMAKHDGRRHAESGSRNGPR